MKIKDVLLEELMLLDLVATTKEAAIDEMIAKLVATGKVTDGESFKAGILAREAQTSTGLGDGIAMPHAKNKAVSEAVVLFAKSETGVDYEALDGQPTFLFFMIAVPEAANDLHLKTLATLSRLLVNPTIVANLKKADSPKKVLTILETEEKLLLESDQAEELKEEVSPSADKFFVAVTACPTGIAHTFMAADALKAEAEKQGYTIKVETNGSEGIKNRLTKADIERADGVIVAADTTVEMARFAGKKLIQRPVSDGVRKAAELIEQAAAGEGKLYQGKASEEETTEESPKGSLGSQVYQHLMNGVSHMLPFVIGGGIAIALAFMIDQAMGVPVDSLQELGSYNAFPAYINSIGGAAFGFMLPILAGFIASSISDRPGLVVGFVAGALASSGGSGFLGALIGGFLAGYVMELLKKIFSRLPHSLEGIRTILFYPVFGVIIIGALMYLVNIPMAALNSALNNFLDNLSGANLALLGALLGGMMAVDLGGPVNKAAYVFGTGTLAASVATGGSTVMAAVMAGGMVPPLAIFIATLLFKNKFSQNEQEAGLTNLIMGASFITEGAIPFAASNPLRILPGFIAGSALAGGLVGMLGIKLMAPHGGIFVILLIDQPWFYLLFTVIGSFVAAIIIGLMLPEHAEA